MTQTLESQHVCLLRNSVIIIPTTFKPVLPSGQKLAPYYVLIHSGYLLLLYQQANVCVCAVYSIMASLVWNMLSKLWVKKHEAHSDQNINFAHKMNFDLFCIYLTVAWNFLLQMMLPRRSKFDYNDQVWLQHYQRDRHNIISFTCKVLRTIFILLLQ